MNLLSFGPVRGTRVDRDFRLKVEREFGSRTVMHRMDAEGEVADAVIAMLHMPGLRAADIDLSAGMVTR
ncbi:hypothetical protein [Streptomyces nodosus]|uniref:hypothetical protein n=1 Tax=Streptomyces nodosus TaxID=40318 RepID=UPI0011865F85|nr:hypothetical protein [Streptomyces nodosus]MBB4796106.1 hypothetical protein [Streptomyces nodosus]